MDAYECIVYGVARSIQALSLGL